jgi:hypothetical protein
MRATITIKAIVRMINLGLEESLYSVAVHTANIPACHMPIWYSQGQESLGGFT